MRESLSPRASVTSIASTACIACLAGSQAQAGLVAGSFVDLQVPTGPVRGGARDQQHHIHHTRCVLRTLHYCTAATTGGRATQQQTRHGAGQPSRHGQGAVSSRAQRVASWTRGHDSSRRLPEPATDGTRASIRNRGVERHGQPPTPWRRPPQILWNLCQAPLPPIRPARSPPHILISRDQLRASSRDNARGGGILTLDRDEGGAGNGKTSRWPA